MSLRPVPIVPRKSALSSIEGFNRFAPFIMRISPFQSFQTFNRFAPFKAFQASAGSKRSKVPVVPIGEDVPEATILPERRRKTSGILPSAASRRLLDAVLLECTASRRWSDELRSKEAFAFANVHSNERFG